MIKGYFRFAGLGVALIMAGAVSPAHAQVSAEDCYELRINQSLQGIAQACSSAAGQSIANGVQKGLAWKHAAEANRREGRPQDALIMVQKSYSELAANDGNLGIEDGRRVWDRERVRGRRAREQHEADRQAFFYNRAMLQGALSAELSGTAACSFSCLQTAIDALKAPEMQAAANALGAPASEGRSQYYFTLGQLVDRRSERDADEAIGYLRQVQYAPMATNAAAEIERIAMRVADQAATGTAKESYERAIEYYEIVTDQNPGNQAALFGFAKANRSLAGLPNYGSAEYSDAADAFTRLADLRSSGGDAAGAAEAQRELGQTYNQWARFLETTSSDVNRDRAEITRLRSLGSDAYRKAAAGGASSPSIQLDIARNTLALGQISQAATEFGLAGDQFAQSGQGRQAAEAYLEQANILNDRIRPINYAEIDRVLGKALSANPNSAATADFRGRNYLAWGQPSLAKSSFQQIISGNDAQQPDRSAYLANAYYQMSRLRTAELSRGSDGRGVADDTVVSYADQAVTNAVSDDGTYRRHACLMRILASGKWVEDTNRQAHCLSGGNADTNLVKAMFLMRQAAELPDRAQNDNQRAQLRSQARRLIPVTQADRTVGFQGFGGLEEPSLINANRSSTDPNIRREAYLIFLTELSEVCNYSGGRAELPPEYSGLRDDVRSFWRFYRMTECVVR